MYIMLIHIMQIQAIKNYLLIQNTAKKYQDLLEKITYMDFSSIHKKVAK